MERLLRALLAALLSATALIGLAQPALATECGCTEVGPYERPEVRSWTPGASSPGGGLYTLTTTQDSSFATLHVRQTAGNALVQSFSAPLSRLQYGWSPDGRRFMVRHGQPGSQTHDTVVLWDLVGDRQIVSTGMTSGAATGFSPHGKYFYVNQLLGPGWANIDIWNASTPGTVALSRGVTFASVPGSGADSFGSIGMGFSSDADDRSFVYAYRAINGSTEVSVRNLQTRADVYSTSLTNASGAFWRFSPCGDAFAIASSQLANTVDVTIRKTATNATFGSRTFNPLPAVVTIESTLAKHRIRTVSSSGATTLTDVADNTADTSCPAPPALTSLGLSPTTVTGGASSSTATLTLTSAATTAMTASLSSSDTSAATVPSSVAFATGQTSRTFTVTSKAVTAARTTTISATVAGITRTATLTVNPATTTPPASRRVTALAIAPSTVTSGQTSLATVTLDGAAPAGGTTVALSAPAGSPVVAPATVTVPAGMSTGSATLTTSAVPSSTPVTLTATAGGGTATAVLTVVPGSTSTSPQAVVVDPACAGAELSRNDDRSTDQVPLPFPVNFFGLTADHLYVNNNGNVTFGRALSTYTPFAITATTPPIIAPFLADVDTEGFGNGSRPVTYSVAGAPAMFEGRPAFCVNWVDVGYYNNGTDKLNSFQLLLVDRGLPANAPATAGHDFDIVMNYDRIVWEAGNADGGSGGLGGLAAGAGYSPGTSTLLAGGDFPEPGRKADGDADPDVRVASSAARTTGLAAAAAAPTSYFEFPGSRTNGAFLDSNEGSGLTRTSRGTLQRGRHVFEVRNGDAPTGRTLTGVVTGPDGAPVVGAPVQVCAGTVCRAFTSTGAAGQFQAPGLPAGTYDVRVQPPAGSTLFGRTVQVTLGTDADVTENIALTGPTPLPGGTTVEPSTTNGQGIPNVYWGDELQVTTTGCAGGTATWTVSRAGQPSISGSMTESTPGQYAGTIPPLRDFGGGTAQVTLAIDCPEGTPDEQDVFDLYIDPSGNVLTLAGNPVPDALVTLLRSDTADGPLSVVPDGSVVMSPGNRTNPDRTDAVGHFGWDTLAGFYVVQAEREGCTAPGGGDFVRTDVLPVPPEWTELELVLDCPSLDAQQPADTEAPTATHSVTPSANAAGWHRGPVTIALSASDAGTPTSGVQSITWSTSGASTGGATVPGASVDVPVSQQGDTTLTYFATDAAGNVSEVRSVVVSIDSTAPVLRCTTSPTKLGPPNHKLLDVRAAVGVTDSGSGSAGFRLVSVKSSEPDNGLGDGDTAGDISGWNVGSPDTDGKLRAERSGKGSGRTYTLTYVATDIAGNTSAPCVTKVTVAK